MNNLGKKIDDARFNIFMRDPFLGYVLQNYEIFINKGVQTAYTDGKHIVVGQSFLKKLSLEETMFILLHESLHIILGHVYRSRDLEPRKFNLACDIVVNDILEGFVYRHGSLKPQYGEDYGIYSYLNTAEQVYETLPNLPEIELIDIHSFWGNLGQEDMIKAERKLEKIINEAESKGYTLSASALSMRIAKIKYANKKHRWGHILEKYITKGIKDYSYQRTDYRYRDMLLPSYMANDLVLKNIWFVIDISGSMSNQLVSYILGEVDRIISHFRSVSCDVSFFSTKTTEPKKFRDSKTILKALKDAKSTGGTDFNQIFDYMKNYYQNQLPKLVIILTDGYASYPDQSASKNVPILWVTDNKNMKPSFGEVIHIQ